LAEGWGGQEFNLLEFIGQDDISPVVEAQGYQFDEPLEEDDSVRKDYREDVAYQTNQMQHALYNDYAIGMISPSMDPMLANGGVVDNESSYHDVSALEQMQASVPSSSSSFSTDHQYASRPASVNLAGAYMPASVTRSANRPSMIKVVKDELPSHYQLRDEPIRVIQHQHQQEVGGGPMRAEKPRKYRIKSENERRNPVYRQKREKNNDAVRRSRNKAKQQQEQRESRLDFLEKDVLNKSTLIAQLESKLGTHEKALKEMSIRNKKLEAELAFAKNNCTCRRARR
jgi:hypothetical protein